MEVKDDLDVPTSNSEDELDRELEELAAIVTHPPSVGRELDSKGGGITREGEAITRLSFEFPGWGVDICQDAKRKGAAVTRHSAMLSQEVPPKSVEKSFGEADKPGNGTFVYGMPNEVWMHILTRLNMKDLCSIMQTCRWLHSLASQDEIWLSFHSPTEEEEEEGNKPSDTNLPRWIKIKSGILNFQMKRRFSYYSKGYDHMRSALNAWWDAGGPDCHYSSKSLHSLICKMTARDWTIVYEAFPVIFSERADRLAGVLLAEFGSAPACNVDTCFLKKGKSLQSHWSCMKDLSTLKGIPLSSTSATSHLSSDGSCTWMIEPQDGLVGKEMWQLVLSSWKRYKHWLTLVSAHCQDLNYEVMVERARPAAWSSTPTVYDKGVICFRNQILLRFKIRNALQCGLSWLIGQDALDFASESDVHLLRAVFHLLQEVDVADDFTLSSKTHTRAKLKRCFLLNGVTSKVLPGRASTNPCQYVYF